MYAFPPLKPIIIAIAGPTCSGKTLIANRLADELTDAAVISMDSYYRDLTTVLPGELEHWNFDQPASIDYKLLIEHVKELSAGRSIMKPVYRFPSHTRATKRVNINPKKFVILDGLFALYWKEVLRNCQLKVFVQVSDNICLKRRLRRDPTERGFTPEYITMQYNETVRPMYRKYVHSTRFQADIIINGENPVADSVEHIIDNIDK